MKYLAILVLFHLGMCSVLCQLDMSFATDTSLLDELARRLDRFHLDRLHILWLPRTKNEEKAGGAKEWGVSRERERGQGRGESVVRRVLSF